MKLLKNRKMSSRKIGKNSRFFASKNRFYIMIFKLDFLYEKAISGLWNYWKIEKCRVEKSKNFKIFCIEKSIFYHDFQTWFSLWKSNFWAMKLLKNRKMSSRKIEKSKNFKIFCIEKSIFYHDFSNLIFSMKKQFLGYETIEKLKNVESKNRKISRFFASKNRFFFMIFKLDFLYEKAISGLWNYWKIEKCRVEKIEKSKIFKIFCIEKSILYHDFQTWFSLWKSNFWAMKLLKNWKMSSRKIEKFQDFLHRKIDFVSWFSNLIFSMKKQFLGYETIEKMKNVESKNRKFQDFLHRKIDFFIMIFKLDFLYEKAISGLWNYWKIEKCRVEFCIEKSIFLSWFSNLIVSMKKQFLGYETIEK